MTSGCSGPGATGVERQRGPGRNASGGGGRHPAAAFILPRWHAGRPRRPAPKTGAPAMSLLTDLTTAIQDGGIQVIDLTAPLNDTTPVIRLPEPFGNTATFALHEISRYDDRGPAWYWNDISTGEHTGTHFDAPVHWVTGKDGADVSQVPVDRLIAPAAVLDFTAQAAADPDFLLEIEHVQHWEAEQGPLPEGGWLLYRTGWDARSASQEEFLNASETGPHTPGVSVACAKWLA